MSKTKHNNGKNGLVGDMANNSSVNHLVDFEEKSEEAAEPKFAKTKSSSFVRSKRARESLFRRNRKQTVKRTLRQILREEKLTNGQLDPEDVQRIKYSNFEDEEGLSSCRSQTASILHSTPFSIVIVVLVIIDCLLVASELFLDLRISYTSKEECCTKLEVYTSVNTSSIHKRAASSDGGHGACHADHSTELKIAHAFHYASIAILSLFVVEITVRLITMGCKNFFKSKVEVIDAVVIFISLGVDVALLYANSSSALGFLSVALFWRTIRIVNTLLATYKRRMRLRYELQKIAREKAEKRIDDMTSEIKVLQECLKQVKEFSIKQGVDAQELEAVVKRASRKKSTHAIVESVVGHLKTFALTMSTSFNSQEFDESTVSRDEDNPAKRNMYEGSQYLSPEHADSRPEFLLSIPETPEDSIASTDGKLTEENANEKSRDDVEQVMKQQDSETDQSKQHEKVEEKKNSTQKDKKSERNSSFNSIADSIDLGKSRDAASAEDSEDNKVVTIVDTPSKSGTKQNSTNL